MRWLRNWRYNLVVLSLRLVVLVCWLTGLRGHALADAEGDSGYHKLEAHKTWGEEPKAGGWDNVELRGPTARLEPWTG